MLKLKGWGLRPWMEFEFDPANGQYTKRRLKNESTSLHGYAGFGQELNVSNFGRVLCSMYLNERDMVFRIGGFVRSLFEPGLEFSHRDGFLRCELTLRPTSGNPIRFRYRRTDTLLVVLDSTYDQLDMELANLPANLPAWAQRHREELVAEWEAR
jgi:hypothetical protein